MDAGVAIARLSDIPDTHGLLQVIELPDQMPGNTADATANTHQRWRLLSSRFTCTTPLAGSTRRVALQVLVDSQILIHIQARATQIAGQTRTYNFAPTTRDATAFVATELQTRLPPNLLIPPLATVRLVIANPQPDDEMTAILHTVEEWING